LTSIIFLFDFKKLHILIFSIPASYQNCLLALTRPALSLSEPASLLNISRITKLGAKSFIRALKIFKMQLNAVSTINRKVFFFLPPHQKMKSYKNNF